ncbi:MAG TPA: hypothetical protein EYN79_01570 [Planctomycetes bacterium]|nr:hypothetical protein [Planctomycetota bacterium]HIN80545.1 hypothetical protein [Planctomycetota bacterium]
MLASSFAIAGALLFPRWVVNDRGAIGGVDVRGGRLQVKGWGGDRVILMGPVVLAEEAVDRHPGILHSPETPSSFGGQVATGEYSGEPARVLDHHV